jgi:transmembrane sensor
MQKSFENVEEVISDEMFLSWFYKENDEKAKAWEKWLADNAGYQTIVNEAIELLTALNLQEKAISPLQIEVAYDKLNQKVGELERESDVPVVTMQSSRKRWWLGAAAAVLILFAGLWVFKFSSSKPVIATQYGNITQKELPDGSQVMLNANTTVTLSKNWKEGNDREVWLKGEAFFHVKKTPHKNRFIVHTNQLDVIVTGTQFNIWTRDDKTSVLLTEGSVTIKTNDGKEIFMKPGDFIEMQDNKVEKKAPNEESVLAWKESKLNFDNTPLKDVAIMISNHYGVVIKLSDQSIGEKPITGMMPNNNLDDLLKALEATNDFKITRTDKTILISTP